MIAVTGAIYGFSRYIGIEVEVGVVDNEEGKATRHGGQNGSDNEWQQAGQEMDDGEEDEEEYDDALLFLPTGLSRPTPKKFYRGSDPEWQDFIKMAKDKPRVEKIRGMHLDPSPDVVGHMLIVEQEN